MRRHYFTNVFVSALNVNDGVLRIMTELIYKINKKQFSNFLFNFKNIDMNNVNKKETFLVINDNFLALKISL